MPAIIFFSDVISLDYKKHTDSKTMIYYPNTIVSYNYLIGFL